MSATEELRRLLEERGVEYFKHEDGEPLRKLEKADEPATSWHMGGASVCAVPIEGGDLFDLWIDHCTPEQAVAATLGRGTCHNVHEPPRTTTFWPIPHFKCSECGEICVSTTYAYYCPSCGRKVVDE